MMLVMEEPDRTKKKKRADADTGKMRKNGSVLKFWKSGMDEDVHPPPLSQRSKTRRGGRRGREGEKGGQVDCPKK